jgi:hypothetical protein
VLARFISADTIVPDPANPQALNRYAYVLNNPLKYTDPSGHWVETAFDIAMLGLSVAEFVAEPSVINGLAVAVDAVSTIAPIVPAGGGLAIRALSKADDLAAVAGKVDEAAQIAANAGQAVTREAIVDSLSHTVNAYVKDIKKLAGSDATVGFRGSLARGTVGNKNKPTFGQPINTNDFDVDAFIVSDELRSKGQWGSDIPEVREIQKRIQTELSQKPEFKGLRRNGFGFRIFSREEAKRAFNNQDEIYFTGIE